MVDGIHHIHKRKRIHDKKEAYPHPNKWINLLDKVLLIIAVIGPLMNLPQIAKIYLGRNAAGVSLLTFSFYAFFNTFWIAYGMVHKEKPIIIAHCLWFITNLIVVAGIILYS